MAREIRITIDDDGRLDVWEGDRHSEQLAFDEMIGQVINLTHPRLPEPRTHYPMLTAEEWRARRPGLYAEEPAPTPERPPPAEGMERCTLCGDDVPSGTMKEHDKKCDGVPF